MDRVSFGLSAGAGCCLVFGVRYSGLPALCDLLVVVQLRGLRPAHIRDRRHDRCLGRAGFCGGRDRHVGLARPRTPQQRDLWLGALGNALRDRRRRSPRWQRRGDRAARQPLSAPRRTRACAVLRAHSQRQGCRPRRPDSADLAALGDRARHQGGELGPDRGFSRAFQPRAPVRSDQRGLGRLQPVDGSTARRWRSARRAEHRRRIGRPGRLARAAQSLGEDQPCAARRGDPPRALCGGEQDAGRCCGVSVGPQEVDRGDARRDDAHAAPGGGWRASGRGERCARTAQQIGERALRGSLDRHVLPQPVSRPRDRQGHPAVRLADCRPCRPRAMCDALPGRPALRHQPDQAARSADSQPAGTPPHRRPGRWIGSSATAPDARRVSRAGPARFLRKRARLHGGLRHQGLPDRAIPQPDREGLRPEQCDPRQLSRPGVLRDQRRTDRQAHL